MSHSSNTGGDPVVKAPQIEYKQYVYNHPSYRMDPQYPNTFGQPIVVNSSQSPVTINLPSECYNLSQSYLEYQVNIPAGLAGTYTWTHAQALKEISHIQLYGGNGQFICDCDNLQNYLDIVLKKELAQDDFLSLDPMTGVSRSNSVVNVIPALRNSTVLADNTPNGPANPSSLNYTEPAYFNVGALSAGLNGAVSYIVQFPLRLIQNSVFAIDKDLFFGAVTYLKVYFGPISKVCYSSTSNANPSAGIKTSFAGLAAATVTITNFQLFLAVESNQELRENAMNKVMSGGMSYMIPYIQAFKNSQSGTNTSQNITIQLDSGNGRSLQKIYHAPYSNIEDFDIAYDHSNAIIPGGTSATNQKILTYYTTINSKRVQDLTLDCVTLFTDYMSHRRMLRGSILANLNIFQYNWFHCDDFSKYESDHDNNSSLVSGLSLSSAPITWAFVGSTTRAVALQHYTWFIFTKKLMVSTGQILVE